MFLHDVVDMKKAFEKVPKEEWGLMEKMDT